MEIVPFLIFIILPFIPTIFESVYWEYIEEMLLF